ncbi:MAG: hypothetical protein ACYCQI_10965 [Gammaproteobacteria bacterium]
MARSSAELPKQDEHKNLVRNSSLPGVLVVAPIKTAPKNFTSTTKIVLGSRILSTTPVDKLSSARRSELKKSSELLKQLAKIKELKSKEKKSDVANKLTEAKSPKEIIIAEPRSEENFIPYPISAKQHSNFYAWLPRPEANFKFQTGFDEYTAAMCMFGSTLKGIDQLDGKFALIKHFIKFHPKQKFQDIEHEGPDTYEAAAFYELKKLLLFMNDSGSESPRLRIHLPYYDYVLFGVQLFVRGRITLPALDKFFRLILQKKAELSDKITQTCHHFNKNINVIITSPYETLFDSEKLNAALSNKDETGLAKTILEQLKVDVELAKVAALNFKNWDSEVEPDVLDKNSQKDLENKLSQAWLHALRTNKPGSEHQQVWKDFEAVMDQAMATATAKRNKKESKDTEEEEESKFWPIELLLQNGNVIPPALSARVASEKYRLELKPDDYSVTKDIASQFFNSTLQLDRNTIILTMGREKKAGADDTKTVPYVTAYWNPDGKVQKLKLPLSADEIQSLNFPQEGAPASKITQAQNKKLFDMIAMHCGYHPANFSRCVYHPLSEKQIQISFAAFNKDKPSESKSKQPQKNSDKRAQALGYSTVFFITHLDSVLAVDRTNKNLLFNYQGAHTQRLTKLIQNLDKELENSADEKMAHKQVKN